MIIKLMLLTVVCCISNITVAKSQCSDYCFIGDSIAQGYKQASRAQGDTRIGASSKEVLNKVKSTKCNKVVLSSGISNSVNDFVSVEKQLSYLNTKEVKVVLLGVSKTFPKKGNLLNIKLNSICSKYSTCTFNGGFIASKDNVHPKSYREI